MSKRMNVMLFWSWVSSGSFDVFVDAFVCLGGAVGFLGERTSTTKDRICTFNFGTWYNECFWSHGMHL